METQPNYRFEIGYKVLSKPPLHVRALGEIIARHPGTPIPSYTVRFDDGCVELPEDALDFLSEERAAEESRRVEGRAVEKTRQEDARAAETIRREEGRAADKTRQEEERAAEKTRREEARAAEKTRQEEERAAERTRRTGG